MLKQRFVLEGCPEDLAPGQYNVRVVGYRFDGIELVTSAVYIGEETDEAKTVHRQDSTAEGRQEHEAS